MFKKLKETIKYWVLKLMNNELFLTIFPIDPNLEPHIYTNTNPKSSKKN